jgi:hypothetical protein
MIINKLHLIGLWLGVAVILGSLQLIAQQSYSKQDDPDQAKQRPGFVSEQRETAPSLAGVAYGNRPTVIIFDRMSMNSSVFHDLADQAIISDRANLIFVTESDMKPTILGGVKATFTDSDESIAKKYHFDTPTDGGYPVGYVIIDSKGIIRYRTLDPNYMHNADEIEITLKDVK